MRMLHVGSNTKLLIVPEGIEIKLQSYENLLLQLLIVPEGIEIRRRECWDCLHGRF